MKKSFSALTAEQIEEFRELYRKGYSARMIFRELGQDYEDDCSLTANCRMRNYRIRLGLLERGVGFQPTVRVRNNPEYFAEKQEQNRQLRIKKLRLMIPVWTRRVKLWENELRTLVVQNRTNGEN